MTTMAELAERVDRARVQVAKLLTAPARAAALAREIEVEAEMVKHSLIAELDTANGAVRVYVPPAPAPGRRAKPNSSEGRTPPQRTSSEELAQLRAKAAKLQAVVADPGASQDAKATARSELDPILEKIRAFEVALGGTQPAATGQSRRSLFIEPEAYWTRNADPLQQLVEVLNDPSTSVADLAHARARFNELQREIDTHGGRVPLDQ